MSALLGSSIETLRAIQAITDGAVRFHTPDEALRSLLTRTQMAFSACWALIFILDDEQLVLHATAAGLPVTLDEICFPAEGKAVAAVSAASGKPAQLNDETILGQLNKALGKHSTGIVAIALCGEEGPLGMLMLGTSTQAEFSEEETTFLQLIADRAATVILHAQLFEQIRAGRARAQVLSQQLMAAQEAERRHLARELHDEVGQALTAIKINLQSAQTAETVAVMTARIDESMAMVDQAIQQVRNLSLDLRPSLLDDLGLVAALRWYLDRQAQRVGYRAEFSAEPPGIRASASLETACFRVVQEALTNIARHAQARHVSVELRRPRTELELVISDDGVGFDVATARQRAASGASLGLLGMQERVLLSGGRIDIDSTPGQGTRIIARLPLSAQPAVERRRKRRAPP